MFQVPGRKPPKNCMDFPIRRPVGSAVFPGRWMRRWEDGRNLRKFFIENAVTKCEAQSFYPQKNTKTPRNHESTGGNSPPISPNFVVAKVLVGKGNMATFPFATCKFGPCHQLQTTNPNHQFYVSQLIANLVLQLFFTCRDGTRRKNAVTRRRVGRSEAWNAAAKGLNFGMVGCWLPMREGWGTWVIFFVERQTDVRNGHQ